MWVPRLPCICQEEEGCILFYYFIFIFLEENVNREKFGHNLGLKATPKSRGAGNP